MFFPKECAIVCLCLAGIIIIGMSIFLGYVVEEMFKHVKIANWRKLIEFVGVFYLMISLMLASLRFYSLDVSLLHLISGFINASHIKDYHFS